MDARKIAEAIRQQVDIVAVIGREVVLKRVGKHFRGLCPFHTERTPSFYVHPESKFFFCYGCKAGGDVVRFVEQHRGTAFREACEILISEFALPIVLSGAKLASIPRDDMQTMRRLHTYAARFYSAYLKRVPIGLRYLTQERKLTHETITYFGLGTCAPERRDVLYVALRQKLEADPKLSHILHMGEQTGLWGKKGGHMEDRFIERVMIPIHDEKGQVVGFSGRVIGDRKDVPKYWNSPESELFHKRDILYGFFQAKSHIRQSQQVFLVEGYFDVMKLKQAGVPNVCATMGTALSHYWIKRLKRLVKEVIMVFDGDKAGLDAMVRHATDFFSLAWEPRVMVLPRGLDPDTFIDQEGKDAFLELARSARRYGDFYFMHRFQECQQSYFSLLGLFRQMVEVLGSSCPYPVAVARLEAYLDMADLGTEVHAHFVDALKQQYAKPGSDKNTPSRRGEGVVPTSRYLGLGRLEELRLLQLAICTPDRAVELASCIGALLKEKAICDLILALNEYKEVLSQIPDYSGRVQFLRHSCSSSEASLQLVFEVLVSWGDKGVKDETKCQQMWHEWMERLKQKTAVQQRKIQLALFKQKYAQGDMHWEEVVSALEEMERKCKDTTA